MIGSLALPLLLTVAIVDRATWGAPPAPPAPLSPPAPTAPHAPPAPSATQDRARCDIVEYGNASGVAERWVRVEGVRRTLVLEYAGEVDGVASALLASALHLAGYRSTHLRRETRSLAARSYADYDETEAVVALAARWAPGDVWSGWLRAVGVSLVPLTPRLHRRGPPNTSTHTHRPTIYVAVECERFANRMQFNASIVRENRSSLVERIRSDDDETFMFLDVEVWSDEPNVEVDADAFLDCDVASASKAISVADGMLWLYSPAFWHLLSGYAPRPADLRYVLTTDIGDDPMAAVCERAVASSPLLHQLRAWAESLNDLRYVHYVIVFLCTGTGAGGDGAAQDNDTIDEYKYLLLDKLQVELNLTAPRCVNLDVRVVNCAYDDVVTKHITDLMESEKFYRTIGVIGPGRIFRDVRKQAESRKLSLMSYTAVEWSTVGTVAGRAGVTVGALRDILAACGWQRLAVLSDAGRAAADLSAALTAENDLNMKFVSLGSDRAAIRDVLESLKSSDARVFLLNAGAQVAEEVMRVAMEVGLTARAGRVWLAREWLGVPATAALEAPFELTFAWRGGDGGDGADDADGAGGADGTDGADGADDADGADGADGTDGTDGADGDLHCALSERWAQRGSWPLHAAPLADAVLALGNTFSQMFKIHPNFYDDVHADDTFRTFWNLTETEGFSRGVVQELRFEDRELKSPRVFLYRWNGTRAELIVEWRVGGGAATCPVTAVSDGSRPCAVPAGDRFDTCGDAGLIAGLLALIALVPLLVVAAAAARRALHARDAHLVKRAEEMLEARWQANTSPLEPYFVKRRDLVLREQIGAGRFGRVWLGRLKGGAGAGPVAVKALREGAAPVEETEFFREARALAALQHENVVHFVGVCVTDGPPLLLMEYAFFGDLLRYLRARRHLVARDSLEAAQVSAEALTRFARQAAGALAFLAQRGFVHRDVRAANCLVDERRDLKLADFGMARATSPAPDADTGTGAAEYTSRRRALFPVLWMAPESLSRGVFSPASDVWALGVLALELVTLGARPYGALSPLQVHQYVVGEGGRPPLPRELGAEARGMLLACWQRAPAERPSAAALAAWLAARCLALAPAPLPSPDDDVDSGIGGGELPSSPSHLTRSSCIDDLELYDDDASLS